MRSLYLVAIFLVGITVLTFMTRQLEYSGTSSPEPLFHFAYDAHAHPQRFLQVHAASEEDTTDDKGKSKEERAWWNEVLYKLAWKSNNPEKAFSRLRFTEQDGIEKVSKKVRDRFKRLVKYRGQGKKIDDDRIYQLLRESKIPKALLVPAIASLRSDHSLTEVADTMLGKLASEAEMTERVFDEWLKCKAHPAIAFNTFLEHRIRDHQSFAKWLDYINSYRSLEETNFSDEELFHLLTNDKLNSYEILVETFNALLHQDRFASNTVASNMMIYMAADSATSQLVLESMLASEKTPRGVFEFLHLDKPDFDINLFEPWVKYCEMYQGDAGATSASSFSDQDFASLLKSIPNSSLKQVFTSLHEELPTKSRAVTAQLSSEFVKMLTDNKPPREYFDSLRPAIKLETNNDLFKQWISYAMAYMELKEKSGDQGQHIKQELIDFLMQNQVVPVLVKAFNGLQKSRMIKFADEILLTMASLPEAKNAVYNAWLASEKHPKVIFESVSKRGIGLDSEFENWLEYVQLYWKKRATNTFSDSNLYHLLTDDKLISDEAVVNLFVLLSNQKKPALKTVADTMVAYMTVNAATTPLVFKKWLLYEVNPVKIFDLRHLDKPNFDRDFMKQWFNYVKIFRAHSETSRISRFNEEECTLLFRGLELNPDLEPLLKSLQEDPNLKGFIDVLLADLNISKNMDTWLASNINPGDVWAMLTPDPHFDSNNLLFRVWIRYADKFMKRINNARGETGFTVTNLVVWMKEKSGKSLAEVKTLLESLKIFPDTEHISDTMLELMATDPGRSLEIFKIWEQENDVPFNYFKIFPLQRQTPETTFVAWLSYLDQRTAITNPVDIFDALCKATSVVKESPSTLVTTKLELVLTSPSVKDLAESLLRTKGPSSSS